MQIFTEHKDKKKVKFHCFIGLDGKIYTRTAFKPTDFDFVKNTGKYRQFKGKKYNVIACRDDNRYDMPGSSLSTFTYLGRWPRKRKLTAAKE